MRLWSIIKRSFSAWSDHDATTYAAALAFYSILSLAPLVLLFIPLAGLVLGHSSARYEVVAEIRDAVGPTAASAVDTILEQSQRSSGVLATTIALVTMLFGASGVFSELRTALNIIWNVKSADGTGIVGLIRERFATFGMVLVGGVLLLASLLLSAATAAVGHLLDGRLPIPASALHLINWGGSFIAIALVFGLIFKYVPESWTGWRDVWIGAVVTSCLFTIGKYFIGLYLGKAAVGSAYGAAGSMVALIVWIYYSSLIFLFGAEFTHERAVSKPRAAVPGPSV